MSNISYLNMAATDTYSESAFEYISSISREILDAAAAVGVSAGALAGALVEENHAFGYLSDYPMDYSLVYWRSKDSLAADYGEVQTLINSGADISLLDKVQHPTLVDLGPANQDFASTFTLDDRLTATNLSPALARPGHEQSVRQSARSSHPRTKCTC